MVVIRLKRVGVKHSPCYRVVVADSRRAALGRFIENVGRYNPLSEDKLFHIDKDRYNYWLKKGAQPTRTVKSLFTKTLNKEK